MSRRVHKKESITVLFKNRLFGKHGYSPAALYLSIIKERILVVHPAGSTDHRCLVKYLFGESRLSCVNVSQDSERQIHKITPLQNFLYYIKALLIFKDTQPLFCPYEDIYHNKGRYISA